MPLETLATSVVSDLSPAPAASISHTVISSLGGLYSMATPTRIQKAVENVQPRLQRAAETASQLKTRATQAVDKTLIAIRDVVDRFDVDPHEHVPKSIKTKVCELHGDISARVSLVKEGIASAQNNLSNHVSDVRNKINTAQDQVNERFINLTMKSIERVDAVVEYILPEDKTVPQECDQEELDVQETLPKKAGQAITEPEPEEQQACVSTISTLSATSRNIASKVTRRLQKRVFKRFSSTQGFIQRNTDVIHTSLVDYASNILDKRMPTDVRHMYSALSMFPSAAQEIYTKLAGQQEQNQNVDEHEFADLLEQAMGDTWLHTFRPAALAYCRVVNRALQVQKFAVDHSKEVKDKSVSASMSAYAVFADKSAVIFNHSVSKSLRAAALAYLKRVNEASMPPSDDSFLSHSASKIAAVISVVKNDVQGMCVRLYDPLTKRWEVEAGFNFGTKLMTLVRHKPAKLRFHETYGYLQGLLSVQPIEQILAQAKHFVFGKSTTLEDSTAGIDESCKLIDLREITDQVCNELPSNASKLDFDEFINRFRAVYEKQNGEWSNTLLESARRMFDSVAKARQEIEETPDLDCFCDDGEDAAIEPTNSLEPAPSVQATTVEVTTKEN